MRTATFVTDHGDVDRTAANAVYFVKVGSLEYEIRLADPEGGYHAIRRVGSETAAALGAAELNLAIEGWAS